MAREVKGSFQPGSAEVITYWKEAGQRYHDYYVGLARYGQLPPEEQANLDNALGMERRGEVGPLPPLQPQTSGRP